MKVLFLTHYYAPHQGGVEKHVAKVAEELRRQGHQVRILTERYDPSLAADEMIDGIEVKRFPSFRTPKIQVGQRWWWLYQHRQWLDWADVIHGHDLYWEGIRWLSRKPYIMTFHGYEGYPLRPEAIRRRQWMAHQVQATIQVGDYIQKWYGTTPTKVTYGAVETVSAQLRQRHPKAHQIVFVGRLEKDTGILAYMAAFEQLASRGQTFTATICGDGSLRPQLEQMAQQQHLPVTFVGMVPNPLEYMAEAEVICVAGYLAIIEAASLSRPIVAYFDTPLKRDYLQLMPIANQLQIADTDQAIAEALLKGLTGQIDQGQLSTAATWAKKQTWSALVDTYLQAYQQFL